MPDMTDHSQSLRSVYRAYVIGDGNRIRTAIAIDAENDQDAIEKARQFVDGHCVEVWDRSRKLVTIGLESASKTRLA